MDLFAGGGGASTGIEQAIGRAVDVIRNSTPLQMIEALREVMRRGIHKEIVA